MKELTKDLLDRIIEKLVSSLKPEQIILFGSYAYGQPNENSDVDLLVVVSESNEPRYRGARKAYQALRGVGLAIDIIVMTKEEFERKINVRSSLVHKVMHDGRVLYGS